MSIIMLYYLCYSKTVFQHALAEVQLNVFYILMTFAKCILYFVLHF